MKRRKKRRKKKRKGCRVGVICEWDRDDNG